MSNEDPLSPANVGAHVLVLLLLLFSGCVIEWAKQKYHPPLFTNTMLVLGELVIIVYMVGSLGKALRWTINEWRGDGTIVRGHKEGFLKQFVPRKIDMRKALHVKSITRWLIAWFLTLAFLILTSEIHMTIMWGNANYPDGRDGFALVPAYLWIALWRNISAYMPYFMLITVGITAVTLFVVITTVFVKRPAKA